jgi:hypothetical protein
MQPRRRRCDLFREEEKKTAIATKKTKRQNPTVNTQKYLHDVRNLQNEIRSKLRVRRSAKKQEKKTKTKFERETTPTPKPTPPTHKQQRNGCCLTGCCPVLAGAGGWMTRLKQRSRCWFVVVRYDAVPRRARFCSRDSGCPGWDMLVNTSARLRTEPSVGRRPTPIIATKSARAGPPWRARERSTKEAKLLPPQLLLALAPQLLPANAPSSRLCSSRHR